MTMKSKYIAFAMMGAMMQFAQEPKIDKPREFVPKKEPKKIIPKGCKEFSFYNKEGNLFQCIALSEKTAKKKFNKWLKNQKK